jgi:hypothetical protein
VLGVNGWKKEDEKATLPKQGNVALLWRMWMCLQEDINEPGKRSGGIVARIPAPGEFPQQRE